MRQRHVPLEEKPVLPPAPQPLARHIAGIDLFPKPREDYQREQTKQGAIVSLVTVAVILLLIAWEGIAYLRGRDAYDTDVTVDSCLSDEMQVNLDVFFPNLPCHRLSVDVIDATGTRKFNCTGTIHKLPCGVDERSLYLGSQRDLNDVLELNSSGEEGGCKRCPSDVLRALPEGARRSATSKCCNTCESVLGIFSHAQAQLPQIEYVPQCLEKLSERARGCNVVGALDLKKVPVTVVFGPRRTGVAYAYKDILRLDTSHRINKLRIGNESVKRFSEHGVAEPLSGHISASKTYLETRYYIKVVPTTYSTAKAQDASATTYEYSAQWSARPIRPGFNGAAPAVLLSFEPSAIQVNNIFKRPPLTHFVVQLCGIVGGVFVVLGTIDRCVERIVMLLKG